jgi:hypothetical protein
MLGIKEKTMSYARRHELLLWLVSIVGGLSIAGIVLAAVLVKLPGAV